MTNYLRLWIAAAQLAQECQQRGTLSRGTVIDSRMSRTTEVHPAGIANMQRVCIVPLHAVGGKALIADGHHTPRSLNQIVVTGALPPEYTRVICHHVGSRIALVSRCAMHHYQVYLSDLCRFHSVCCH